MKTIWKYSLSNSRKVEMPKGATVLSVGMQFGDIRIWALVESDMSKEERVFEVYDTGTPITGNLGKLIGAVQLAGGEFIVHVFEINQ